MNKPFTNRILGVDIAITNIQDTVRLITEQIDQLKGQYIAFSTADNAVWAYREESFRRALNQAFLTLPDSGLLTLVQRVRGYRTAEQVAAHDLMTDIWKATEGTEISHFIYGCATESMDKLRERIEKTFPELHIAGMEPALSGNHTEQDELELVDRINDSGASILWVGMESPEAEQWMCALKEKVQPLMIGAGEALAFHAGTVKRAPVWMRNHYLEWFYDFLQNPKKRWNTLKANIRCLLYSVIEAFRKEEPREDDKKNLLVYAHYYYPDVASTGQILTELAEGLNDSFHTTVICTVPSYTGKISRHYRKHQYFYENINGVNVLRIRVPEFRKNFSLSRIFNILSYFFSAVFATFRVGPQDYVFSISQPPILGGLLGVFGKWIKKAKYIYNIQDFNPEQVMAVEFTRNKMVTDVMMLLDKFSCRQASKVVVVGRDMIHTLEKRFDPMVPYAYINNWINEKEIYPLEKNHPKVTAFKEKYGLQDKFVIMYSGNIGLYYDLANIMQCIGKFREEENVVFAFVGEGSVLEELKSYKQDHNLTNVVFIPYQPKQDLIYSLNAGDVHFVQNAKGIKGVSVPSKLYGVMAVGKPVLGILDKGSEARLIVEESECGRCVEPESYEAIEQLIRYYIDAKDSDELLQMGTKGRSFLVEHFTKDVSLRKYHDEILSCK